MPCRLIPASVDDKKCLDDLRRQVHQELFQATFGGWDETRHAREFAESWQQGGVNIIELRLKFLDSGWAKNVFQRETDLRKSERRDRVPSS